MKQLKSLLLLFLLFTVLSANLTFPKLTGRVVDNAGILSLKTKEKLTKILKNFENKTTDQVVVVTLKSLQGTSISDFGYQLGRYWGIGQKNKNNGVLFIIAPNEKKVRIEVGYGLEGTLTDAISSVIIHQKIIPYFKKGDFDKGVLEGTKAILLSLKDIYVSKHKNIKKSKNLNRFHPLIFFAFIFIIAILQTLFSKKNKNIFAKIIPSSFLAFFAYIFSGAMIIGIIIFIFAFVFFLFSKVFDNVGNNSVNGWSNNDFFFDNGSDNFGGFDNFSGGGGSFGGGGADGGW